MSKLAKYILKREYKMESIFNPRSLCGGCYDALVENCEELALEIDPSHYGEMAPGEAEKLEKLFAKGAHCELCTGPD